MKATVDGAVVAEASKEDLISIEGNWYFPPASVKDEYFTATPTAYTCPWKGEAQYFTLQVEGEDHTDAAWSYPAPYPSGIERVGKDFSGYVAFGPGVTVSEG